MKLENKFKKFMSKPKTIKPVKAWAVVYKGQQVSYGALSRMFIFNTKESATPIRITPITTRRRKKKK